MRVSTQHYFRTFGYGPWLHETVWVLVFFLLPGWKRWLAVGTAVDKTRSSTNGVKSALLCRYGFCGTIVIRGKDETHWNVTKKRKRFNLGELFLWGFFDCFNRFVEIASSFAFELLVSVPWGDAPTCSNGRSWMVNARKPADPLDQFRKEDVTYEREDAF